MHLPAQRKISRSSALRTPQLLEKKCSRKKRSPAGRFLARKSISLITLLAEPDAVFSRPSRRGPVATTTRLVGRRRGVQRRLLWTASEASELSSPRPRAVTLRSRDRHGTIDHATEEKARSREPAVGHARAIDAGNLRAARRAREIVVSQIASRRGARRREAGTQGAQASPSSTIARGSLLVAAQHHAGGQAAPAATAPPRTGRPDQDQAAVLHAHMVWHAITRAPASGLLGQPSGLFWTAAGHGRNSAGAGRRERRAARVNAPATWIWGGSRHADLALPTR